MKNDNKYSCGLIAADKVIAVSTIELLDKPYYSIRLDFPDGSYRLFYVGYSTLENPKQNWDSALTEELLAKKRG